MRLRLTAILVVVSILMYGTAWAFEGHWSEPGDHAHATAHPDPAPLDEESDCDHCCHAGAHLLGLPPRGFLSAASLNCAFDLDAVFLTLARAWDPPFKPPRC